eukprot:8023357-Pyramimonas_sp.AAC.1
MGAPMCPEHFHEQRGRERAGRAMPNNQCTRKTAGAFHGLSAVRVVDPSLRPPTCHATLHH